MKIIDILKESATLLGLTEEVETLENTTEETMGDVLAENKHILSLFNLVKLSTRELCTNYVPVITQTIIESENLQYELSNLVNFIRVQNIQKNGEMVKYKIINRNLVFEEDGVYTINYESYPNITNLFQEIDFLSDFSPDCIVLGLCAYFSLSCGLFEDFQTFHEKYIARAESLKHLKNFSIPARRWE